MTQQVSAIGNSGWNRMVGARTNGYTALQTDPICPPPPLHSEYAEEKSYQAMPLTSRTSSMFVAPIENYQPGSRVTPYHGFRARQTETQTTQPISGRQASAFNAAIYQLWLMQQLQVAGRGGVSERPWSNITLDDVQTLRELSERYGYDSIGYILGADGTVYQWKMNPSAQLLSSGSEGVPVAIGKFHRNGDFVPFKQGACGGNNREYAYDRIIYAALIRTWNAGNGWGTNEFSTQPQSFWCWRKKS